MDPYPKCTWPSWFLMVASYYIRVSSNPDAVFFFQFSIGQSAGSLAVKTRNASRQKLLAPERHRLREASQRCALLIGSFFLLSFFFKER